MKQYIDLAKDVLSSGTDKPNRTDIKTPYTVFGRMIEFDLANGFPLLTTKKMAIRAMVAELLWFIEGSTDERRLAEIQYGRPRSELADKRTIWTDNFEAPYWQESSWLKQYPSGMTGTNAAYLGEVYGSQWRSFKGYDFVSAEYIGKEFDQLQFVIDTLKTNPSSRKMIMLSYSPHQIEEACLTACHTQAQFQVQDGKLNCAWTQASVDLFLGLPFNIASYALLTHMLAKECGLTPGRLVGFLGDVHIYENAVDALREQIERNPLPLPSLILNPDVKDIYSYTVDDISFENYKSHSPLKVKMAV